MRTGTVPRRAALGLLFAAGLSACGYQLRGSNGEYAMPFRSIYLAFPDTSPLGVELKRNLRGGSAIVSEQAAGADATFDVLNEQRNKVILSLNSQGRVREYLLTYTLAFQVRDPKGGLILAPTEISLKRNISFNENQTLAKESEEALLYRDMQTDLVQQIMRRLAAVKAR